MLILPPSPDYFSQSHLIAAWLLAAARYIITCNYCPLKLSPGPCRLRCPALHGRPADFCQSGPMRRKLSRAGLTTCLAGPPTPRLWLHQRWGPLQSHPHLARNLSFLGPDPLGRSQPSPPRVLWPLRLCTHCPRLSSFAFVYPSLVLPAACLLLLRLLSASHEETLAFYKSGH